MHASTGVEPGPFHVYILAQSHHEADGVTPCIYTHWRFEPDNRYNPAAHPYWAHQTTFTHSAVADIARPERTLMSRSNLEDGVADAIAATALISVALVTLMIWLSGLPS